MYPHIFLAINKLSIFLSTHPDYLNCSQITWNNVITYSKPLKIELWLPLRRPLEPPVLQPPHADQDIYAEQRSPSWLEIHISFSNIISNTYRYTVNIDYSCLVYLSFTCALKNPNLARTVQGASYNANTIHRY